MLLVICLYVSVCCQTMLHDSNNQIEVLESLRELQNSDAIKVIANHLWAAADRGNDLLLVCTEYISGMM